MTAIHRRDFLSTASAFIALPTAAAPVAANPLLFAARADFVRRTLGAIARGVAVDLISDEIKRRIRGTSEAVAVHASSTVNVNVGGVHERRQLECLREFAVVEARDASYVGIASHAEGSCPDYLIVEPLETACFDAIVDPVFGLPGVSRRYSNPRDLTGWVLPVVAVRPRARHSCTSTVVFRSPAGMETRLSLTGNDYAAVEISGRGRRIRNEALPITRTAQVACGRPGSGCAASWEDLPPLRG